MHLRLSDEELATLVEMVSLATEMANLNPNDEGQAGYARFEGIENKVLEAAKSTGLAGIVEFDVERGKNRVTEKFQETAYFQKCFNEVRNAVFWEELMIRLAERDLIREIGPATYRALSEEEQRKKAAPLEKRYWAKFQKDGTDPLFWIDRNEDA
ncbi:MAG: hypothetical protein ABF384_16070 [Verrucomicrobiales bacterium]